MGIKTRLAAAALLTLALAIPASAALASSAPDKAATTTTSTHLIPLVVHHDATANAAPDASSPPSCWTQFAPTNPDGIEMAQYYRNCNGYTVNVYFGYTLNGTTHALTNCGTFGDGDSAIVVYPSTVVGSNYGTFFC
jgi:hypothetical protein